MKNKHLISALGALSTSFSVSATDVSFNANVQLGLIGNSDLTIKELDVISSKSDTGTTLAAAMNGEFKTTNNFKFTPSYQYQQTNYHELDQYDLSLHQYSLDTQYAFTETELGIRYDGASASVAEQTFLTLNQVSTYVGSYLNPTTYFRSAVRSAKKLFATQPQRDANGLGLDTSLYYFANQGATMLMFGASIDKETADTRQFSFNGWSLTTQLSHRFTAFDRENKAGIGWRYQDKDYQKAVISPLEEPTASRNENHSVINAFWKVSLLESLSVVTEAEYGDYDSNLAANTYTQTIAKMALKATF